MFAAPPEQSLEWNEAGVEGMSRFLRRLWALVHRHVAAGPVVALDPGTLNTEQKDLRRQVHQTMAKVSDDISRRYTFNTVIAAIMAQLNELARVDGDSGSGRAVLQDAGEEYGQASARGG